ncbi:hypothetical protein [Pyrobaculum ferrireducens]|uniref:Uncharacterized protein n=1 Tax=Pyrobaculum ferrireducens TaxID=1104324 RepID=G7VIE9_9CREN|nr:hypothetical protein [Pyrobaculum ferrireducens]AET33429.1 hypothetical protein P186_2033 [Pyrobaculum ferrireducens]
MDCCARRRTRVAVVGLAIARSLFIYVTWQGPLHREAVKRELKSARR